MVAQTTLILTIRTTEGAQGIRRVKCPIHHGRNRSVAVGFINGRAWAKCWSHGCAQVDILAALNLSNSQVPIDKATYDTCLDLSDYRPPKP